MAGLFDKERAKSLLDAAKQVSEAALSNANSENLKKIGSTVLEVGTAAAGKVAVVGKEAGKKAGEVISTAGTKAKDLSTELKKQKEEIQSKGYSDKAYETTQNLLVSLSQLPLIRVNREEFLLKTFGSSPYIDQILENGPQSVYTVESLRKKSDEIIANSTRKTSVASFVAGLPSSVFALFATVPADIVQYFAFALNLAQKIAYLFGEDDMFTTWDPTADIVKKDGTAVPERAQIRMISYLGTMLGVTGASSLILQTSKTAGASIGKKVAAQALTKTTWYPIIKKVGSILGYKVTKKTVENALTKTVPIVGGFISGGLTFATFKPMGGRLADVFVKLIKGDYDIDLELNEAFKSTLGPSEEEMEGDIIEARFEEISYDPMDLNHDGIVDEKDMELLKERMNHDITDI